ncbi:hypothetical protein HCB26_08030 [Listeria booriae]|uniref:Bacterial Ig domain-containing protein n=1 Tax=Listeria booriae TaxID=1552123 RepID=A0A7X0YZK4_9LIST|nr:toxin Cry1Ac domain D-VI-related protein [Listeria booriae]MBC2166518.1 hypothetical protein [Listeria booriae]
MKKQDLLKKGSSIALVATLVGSQLMTTIPFNVLAAENTANAQAVPYNAVTVSSWTELKAALTSAAVTDINMDADIKMAGHVIVTSTTKNIHGNNHTLDMAGYYVNLNSANTVALVEDLKITNTGIYSLFWSEANNIELTYRNVDHTGGQMSYIPYGHLIIEGTVTSHVSQEEVYEGRDLTIKDNATANFYSTSTGANPIIYLMTASGVLTVGKNATLTTRSKVASMVGDNNNTIMNYGTIDMQADTGKNISLYAGNVYLKDGSSLKTLTGEKTHESILVQNGSLFAESGSTLDVTSNSSETALQTGAMLKLAKGSNFSITNLSTGPALGSYSNATDVVMESGQGVSTWNVKNTTNPVPDASYPGLFNAQFTLSGYSAVTQTKMISNNALFASQFKSNNIGKITGGSFSSKAIATTTLDTVNSDTTTVTGTAEPGADVVLKVGTTVIGQGKAGDDGKYSITIPKQTEGATITATATWNSQTSDATAVVQKGTADQDAAKKAIDALFTDGTKTDIKPTTDAEAIKNTQDLLDKVQDPTVKETLQKDIDKAKELLAKKAVDELFKNDDPSGNAIKDTTDDQAIKDAQKAVDAVAPGTAKDELQSDVDKAKLLLQAEKDQASADQTQKAIAEYAVNQLFMDNDPKTDAIKTTTNQDAIDNAQKEIDKIKDPNLKKDAQKNLDRAQELLNQREADKAVDELFTDNNPANDTIKPTTDKDKINKAEELASKVTDPTVKDALDADIQKAKDLLAAQEAAEKAKQDAAREAVNKLFTGNNPANDTIKPETDKDKIKAAEDLASKVTDPAVKDALDADIQKAKDLLAAQERLADEAVAAEEAAAKKAIDELFNSNDPTSGAIKPETDQTAIDKAKDLLDKVTDPAAKETLKKDLDKAQDLLNDRNTVVLAIPQLNPLTEAGTVFSGKLDVSKYNPGTIRISINNAPATIVAVDANGNFSYNIGNRKVGDVISVDYKDTKGLYNAATKAAITVTPAASNVTINPMTENDDTITGKTTPNAKVRYVVNGQAVNVGYADANGNYLMYIGKQKVGTVVGVELFDPSTNQYKAAVTTTVKAVNVTIQPMTNATDTVSGTAPANAKLRFLINGVAVNVGTADASGNYSKYVGTQLVGTTVAVEMLNPETGKYELAKSTTVTGAPKSTDYTVAPLTTDNDTLTGTAPANAKLRFSINGNLVSVITADASGNYSKFIGKQKADAVVSVELLNENTNQYTAPKAVTVTTGTGNATLAPVINTITEGQGVVTGTVPTSVTTIRVWVNGVAQTMVSATNGNFTWTNANLKAGDTVKVDYKDATQTWISAEKVVTK